jgi:hypothetical protein
MVAAAPVDDAPEPLEMGEPLASVDDGFEPEPVVLLPEGVGLATRRVVLLFAETVRVEVLLSGFPMVTVLMPVPTAGMVTSRGWVVTWSGWLVTAAGWLVTTAGWPGMVGWPVITPRESVWVVKVV